MKISELKIKNENPPPIPRRYEERLIKVAGRNKYGQPNVRLVWGQSVTRFAYGKERMKYLAAVAVLEHKRMNYETGIIEVSNELYDIGIPLWFVEEYWPPELVCPQWEKNRYEQNGLERIDVLGDPPTRGMYRQLLRLETIDALGKSNYRAPDDEVIEWIRELIWKRNQERERWSHEDKAPDYIIQQELKAAAALELELIKKQRERTKEIYKNSMAPHIDRLRTRKPNAGGAGMHSFAKDPKALNVAKPLDFTKEDLKNSWGVRTADDTQKVIVAP